MNLSCVGTAATVVLVALAAAAPVGATAAPAQVWSYGDTQATFDLQPSQSLAFTCPPPAPERGTTTSAKAMKTGWRFLKARANRGVKRFLKSRSARTATASDYAMMVAATHNEPGAALAAALRSATLKPTRRRLLNAADLLTDVGLPREGLALATAAGRRKAPAVSPMGIASNADIALEKGNALLALGRYPAAIAALTVAGGTELEQEAQGSLTAANACVANFARANKAAVRSARRRIVRLVPHTGDSFDQVRADPRDVLDMSKGVDPPFPTFLVPSTPTRMIAMATALSADENAASARDLALTQQVQAAYQLVKPPLGPSRSLGARRAQDLMVYAKYPEQFMPDWAALQAAIDAASFDIVANSPNTSGGSLCGQHGAAHQPLQRQYDAYRAQARAVYRYQTAIAANAAGTNLHHYLSLLAQRRFWAGYKGALNEISLWANGEQVEANSALPACSTGGVSTEPEPGVVADPAESPACPSALDAVKIVAPIGPLKFKGNCETFSVESEWSAWKDDAFNLDAAKIKGDFLWLGAFGSVDHQWRNHETTIFAGPKGKLGFGSVSGEVKDGVYVKIGADGTVADYGFRVEFAGKAKLGPDGQLELKGWGDKMDFSVKGSFGCGIWRGC